MYLVPNSKNLKLDNDNAIIIHFLKERNENINESIIKLSSIQKNTSNIWIVSSSSSSPSPLLKNIDFGIFTFVVTSSLPTVTTANNDHHHHHHDNFIFPFSEILIKINEFLKKTNYSGLKIF